MDDETRPLQAALAAIQRGDRAAGQALLARVLRANPRNVEAWLWMAGSLDDPARRSECYRRVLEIDPANAQARQYLFSSSPPATPALASVPPAPPPPAGAARKQSPGRALVLLLLVILACVACWAIAFPSRSPGNKAGIGSSPTLSPTPQKALLPGLTQGDLKVYFEARHFTCTDRRQEQQYSTRTCTRETDQAVCQVVLYSKYFFGVDSIDATVMQFGNPDDATAADFLGDVAAFPYDGAEPAKARAWVETELPTIKPDEVRTATFGGVQYTLSGKPAARTLTMGRLDAPLE